MMEKVTDKRTMGNIKKLVEESIREWKIYTSKTIMVKK
jgi:hypothetical protein